MREKIEVEEIVGGDDLVTVEVDVSPLIQSCRLFAVGSRRYLLSGGRCRRPRASAGAERLGPWVCSVHRRLGALQARCARARGRNVEGSSYGVGVESIKGGGGVYGFAVLLAKR